MSHLKPTKQLLDSIVENAPVMLFIKEASSLNINLWNSECERVTGISREQLLGKTGYESFEKDEMEGFLERDREVLRGKIPNSTEEQLTTPHGVRILFTRKVPICDEHGSLQFLLGISEDITERKNIERELREKQRALECVSNGVMITDPHQPGHPIIYCNKAFTEMTGYSREEVIGKSGTLLQGADTEQEGNEIIRIAVSEQQSCKVLLRHYKKDGTPFLSQVSIDPVICEDKKVTHYIGILEDVSNSRRLELAVSERDHLRNGIKALAQVLGVVGHELRTPLAGLRALSEFILADETLPNTSPLVQKYIKNIHDEVARMAGTVNDLLEVARMNSGVVRWNWSNFDLKSILDEAVAPIRPLIDATKVSFAVHVDPPDLTMDGDSVAIRRLVVNLLSNSYKHTKEGTIKIDVRPLSDTDPRSDVQLKKGGQSHIVLSVADTGGGIPEKISKWLGEPFALNAGSVGENFSEGTGLGLAICKGIVRAHEGKILIDSREHEGTTVTVILSQHLTGPSDSKAEGGIISQKFT